MNDPESTQAKRALTYTEMMNEGRQSREDYNEINGNNFKERIEELERKVEHLQQVVQRQIRLGRMVE